MMPGSYGAMYPQDRYYGRSSQPAWSGGGARPGASSMGSRSPYGRSPYGAATPGWSSPYGYPYGAQPSGYAPYGRSSYGQPAYGAQQPSSMGFRPSPARSEAYPTYEQAGFRPGSGNAPSARYAKDVKNVTEEQPTKTPETASTDDKATATKAPEPEVVTAEVIEEQPEGSSELDSELETAAGEAVAAAIEESELVVKAQAEAADWKDKYMRLHAEWDTYRRRMNDQRETEKLLANEKMVNSLLPVLDDFERTISYAQDNGETGLLGGVEAVYAKFIDTLKKDGVQVLDPAGQPFDALEAQAVATVSDETVPDETVAQVYQKGYKMGSKVLRPAMVTVTTGGPKRPKAEEDEAAS